LTYENGRIQITINTSGTPIKVPYDPKQIENTMIKSTYTTKMDASRNEQSRREGDEDKFEEVKMTQSEFTKADPMLASVNKSMLATKEPELMKESQPVTGGTIQLKIPADRGGNQAKKGPL
jgi:hypothetical protein